MQSVVVSDDVVVVVVLVGGCDGDHHIVKAPNYKRRGWDWLLNVRMLFQDDLARLGHPLRLETSNKQGATCWCCICCTLISYHNNSWTYAATHILSHNIGTPQDIATIAALASECEANGEPFRIHKLPTPLAVKKEPPNDVALMQFTIAAPSYKTDTQPSHRIKQKIAKWIAANGLPYKTVEICLFSMMTRRLDPKCPDFSRKAIIS